MGVVGAALRGFGRALQKRKVGETISQPRQLKNLMKEGRKEHSRWGFTKAKTAKERANQVRTYMYVKRIEKVDKAEKQIKEGKKTLKNMEATKQADEWTDYKGKPTGKYRPREIKEKD